MSGEQNQLMILSVALAVVELSGVFAALLGYWTSPFSRAARRVACRAIRALSSYWRTHRAILRHPERRADVSTMN